MGRETDAMQFVLDLLTDGILTSTKRQIGHTPHDKVGETDLPFVQIYSPIDENQEEEIRQPPGTLTFQLDIIDVREQSAKLRTAIAALDESLRIDSTFRGVTAKGFVTLRSVAERKVDERSVVGAVVTVQVLEGLPNPERTSVLDFSDVSLWISPSFSTLQDSIFIDGAIGVRKNAVGTLVQVQAGLSTGQSGFPLDLSSVNRLRALVHVDPENSNNLSEVFLDLHSTFNVNFSRFRTVNLGSHGWSFPSFDLNDSFGQGTGPADLSDINEILIQLSYPFTTNFISTEFGVILSDLAYYARDTGDNAGRGYHPGF